MLRGALGSMFQCCHLEILNLWACVLKVKSNGGAEYELGQSRYCAICMAAVLATHSHQHSQCPMNTKSSGPTMRGNAERLTYQISDWYSLWLSGGIDRFERPCFQFKPELASNEKHDNDILRDTNYTVTLHLFLFLLLPCISQPLILKMMT